jgi:hypothetical protein
MKISILSCLLTCFEVILNIVNEGYNEGYFCIVLVLITSIIVNE